MTGFKMDLTSEAEVRGWRYRFFCMAASRAGEDRSTVELATDGEGGAEASGPYQYTSLGISGGLRTGTGVDMDRRRRLTEGRQGIVVCAQTEEQEERDKPHADPEKRSNVHERLFARPIPRPRRRVRSGAITVLWSSVFLLFLCAVGEVEKPCEVVRHN